MGSLAEEVEAVVVVELLSASCMKVDMVADRNLEVVALNLVPLL
jgi:hypothetical protein